MALMVSSPVIIVTLIPLQWKLNDDSQSHCFIPIAWCMILNPVDVRCMQSARDNIIDVIKPCSVLDGERCLEDRVCRQSVKRCDWVSESFWIDSS